MEESQFKLVECAECMRPYVIPAKPAEDKDVICTCGALIFWSDYGVCSPGYTVKHFTSAISPN